MSKKELLKFLIESYGLEPKNIRCFRTSTLEGQFEGGTGWEGKGLDSKGCVIIDFKEPDGINTAVYEILRQARESDLEPVSLDQVTTIKQMHFQHSALGNNNEKNREWLEKLGYRNLKYCSENLYDYLLTLNDGGVIGARKEDIPYLLKWHNATDSTHSNDLFRAVSAIREDSDCLQWFVFDEDIFDKDFNDNIVKIFSEGQFTLCYHSKIHSILAHKATLYELKKKFKKQ